MHDELLPSKIIYILKLRGGERLGLTEEQLFFVGYAQVDSTVVVFLGIVQDLHCTCTASFSLSLGVVQVLIFL